MDEPTTKAQLLEFIQQEHTRLKAQLARLNQQQMVQPGAQDDWSIKDMLAHITTWEQLMVEWLPKVLVDHNISILPPGSTWDDVDAFNAETYEKNQDRPLPEVLDEFEQSYQQALGATKKLAEDDLFNIILPWVEERPLWLIVGANTYWHYREHREPLEVWIDSLLE